VTDVRRVFLEALVDDAGLFPPARLPMTDALAAHVENRNGTYAWMLGRFLCPASRLEELVATLPAAVAELRLGVILDGASVAEPDAFTAAAAADLDRAVAATRSDRRLTVDVVEGRLPAAESGPVAELLDAVDASGLSAPITVYAEAPDSTDPGSLVATVDAVAKARITVAGRQVAQPPGAKIRCGGLTTDMFPDPEAVASFLARAIEQSVPFKATAGLHHPVRGPDPATGAVMHGFINLVGAAVIGTVAGVEPALLEAVVAEDEAAALRLTRDRFAWRGHEADHSAVALARADLVRAYGSCSFEEPIGDLEQLGVLPLDDHL
jgi:hypothetical protein